ncbi:hypothetical protein [Flagellimonas pacifica]|uniref:DUF4134 domain-containing protein n=1 Tax=Flagellimonas pacifica TaxID=1247520 RepID=A0A285MVU2_9FLAO|nr:hypothetical protein [Allomuricauda parva]SNZ01309.1 hypothetical protein SAMN06265377_3147 [Allomuricauda parva]
MVRSIKTRPTPILKTTFLLFFILVPLWSFGQIEELIRETQEFKNDSETLSTEIIGIIKIIAGVAIAISGLTYLYFRDQQSDLTNKLGKAIIGIAIFFALIAVGEGIASL